MRRPGHAALLLGALASAACRHATQPPPTTPAPPPAPIRPPASAPPDAPGRSIVLAPAGPIRGVHLVDSAVVDDGTLERSVYRVAIEHDSSTDTLPALLTLDLPTLVADSLVLGVAYDSTSAAQYSLFRYSAVSGRLEFSDPPTDLRLAVSEPAFAPDGRYLAYIAFPGDATGSGVVRRWPRGELLLQTPSDTVPASDVTGGWASWTDDTHFVLYMTLDEGKWLRFRGAVDRPGTSVDTVTTPTTH